MRLANRQGLNAILCVAEHGGKWRGLAAQFGKWHTVSMRMNRWAKSGGLARVVAEWQRAQLGRLPLEAVSLDSPRVQVHPDGPGA